MTYIIDGAIEHHDSTGGGGTITDGATQWMTAGAGIVHSEMPPEYLVRRAACSTASSSGSTCRRRSSGHRRATRTSSRARSRCSPRPTAAPWCASSPARSTASPGQARPTRRSPTPTPPSSPAPASTSRGGPTSTRSSMCWPAAAASGPRRVPIREGQLAVFGAGDHLVIEGDRRLEGPSRTLEVLILGGLPIREPIVSYGPFVMNTREEIIEAIRDYQAGRMGQIPPLTRLGPSAGTRRDRPAGRRSVSCWPRSLTGRRPVLRPATSRREAPAERAAGSGSGRVPVRPSQQQPRRWPRRPSASHHAALASASTSHARRRRSGRRDS